MSELASELAHLLTITPQMVLHVSAALLLTPVAAAAAAGGGPGELIIHPAWDAEVKHHGVFCLDASTDQGPAMQNNTRFSFYAIPEGVPPDGGFPVYVDFLPVNDQTHNASEVCGDGWQPPNPWIPPDQEPPSCKKQMHASCPETTNFTRCELCVRAASRQHPEARCNPIEPYIHCPQKNGFDTQHYNTFDTPTQMWASCFHQNGSWDLENCGFNQFAGEMWNARVHQYLLANGIAIVALNPFEEDTCECREPALLLRQLSAAQSWLGRLCIHQPPLHPPAASALTASALVPRVARV